MIEILFALLVFFFLLYAALMVWWIWDMHKQWRVIEEKHLPVIADMVVEHFSKNKKEV